MMTTEVPGALLAASRRDHLLGRLAVVESKVAAAVAHRRRTDPKPDDRFRGLYLSESDVDRLLAPSSPAATASDADVGLLDLVELDAESAAREGSESRLRSLARSVPLTRADVDLLMVAIAPELDPRFERLYGYLNDDVTRRRATAGLALTLSGLSALRHEHRRLLAPGSPLVDLELLVLEGDGPFLDRQLRVPDRVATHLLGGKHADPTIQGTLIDECPSLGHGDPVAAAWSAGVEVVYLQEGPGTSARGAIAAAAEQSGRACLHADLRYLSAGLALPAQLRALLREAVFAEACLAIGPIDVLGDAVPAALAILAQQFVAVVLFGRTEWDPRWTLAPIFVTSAPAVSDADRAVAWQLAIRSRVGADPRGEMAAALQAFRLPAEDMSRAASAARVHAQVTGQAPSADMLRHGARNQNGAGLGRLARRIKPRATWRDLLVPPATAEMLSDLAARARQRDTVLGQWGMSRRSSGDGSVVGLFVGESGTGKTLAAEVIAGDLGVDLYVIDLATVIDKYVGETEKNLDRIFTEADQVQALILFDEADALFGKRSEVRDAHDRYANIEVAYLLQRLESFSGLALLTSNLRTNIDAAFARRLDAIVEFPSPGVELRRQLWDICLGRDAPRGADLDLDFCAQAFKIPGGNIRSIVTSAAYLAARTSRPIGMTELMRATYREYRKLGRLCVPAEFGPYHDHAST